MKIVAQSFLAAGFLVGVVASAVACGSSPQTTPAAADDAAAKVSGADTPVPADGQCDFANYHHDESKNGKGPSKCATDCDCDGMRSCTSGECQGKARPDAMTAANCNSKDYHYNEAWTAAGAGKCSGDCECDGLRTCASGSCTGTAR